MKDLNDEQRLVLFLSRVTMNDKIIEKIDSLITKENLNWNYILQISIKNKIIGLIWENIVKLKYVENIPSKILQVLKFLFLGIKFRTETYIQEANNITMILKKNNINFFLLKGAHLIPNMYKKYGIRNMNDIDILVNKNKTKKIKEILNDIGYTQGEYSYKTNLIVPFSRKKEILWQMKSNNMAPFLKIANNEYINCFKIDFCLNFDLDLNKNYAEKIINTINNSNNMHPKDFFLHLCCHFYKEAVNLIWIYNCNDINLMKLCDLREYVHQMMTENDILLSIEIANKCGYSEAMYYSFYCLKHIYSDGYEEKYMNLLNINNRNFVNYFGQNDLKNISKWNKSIFERIFSTTNRDELKNHKPKYHLMS